jgi:transposase
MFLRYHERKKDGKRHRYWSIVENRRVSGGRIVQRHVLYLGEINDSQLMAWRKSISVFDEEQKVERTLALFPEDRCPEVGDETAVAIRLKEMRLERPRQWGACWLACKIYDPLGLDEFWRDRLPVSRKGTRWDLILKTLVAYRLIDPGSEWRLHREWFERSAMGDLIGVDYEVVESHKLYRCLDYLLKHKRALFDHLTGRWRDLFHARFEVLLYDLTSTYFESDPPFPESDKRKFGYSRDKRKDCVQVVIALVVTTEGFPLAYEVLPGNTQDKTTLSAMLEKITGQYGKAERIWLMDRGIPTEEVLAQMRQSDPPVSYLVGTPKGQLSRWEAALVDLPWQTVHDGVEVKLFSEAGEVYVLAKSRDRINKERSIRRRQLKILWERLRELRDQKLTRDQLLLKLGAAKGQCPSAWRLVAVELPTESHPKEPVRWEYRLRKDKLRVVRRREGRYLLRSNLTGKDPTQLWNFYMLLNRVEEAFKNLKGDLAIRPIFHQRECRIEAHIFVAFVAYALHATLHHRLSNLAPGLTPRSVLEKFRAIQMIDVHLPTTDQREIVLCRYTHPESEQDLLLQRLKLQLPPQPPPRLTVSQQLILPKEPTPM